MPKDTAYHEAEKKIQAALQSGATELVLGGGFNTKDENKLTELPESIWELRQLESLTISHTKLTALPESIEKLTELTSLDLSNNQLTTLPVSIGQLIQLQSLNLSTNELQEFPKSVSQLHNLKSLDISDNQLKTFPKYIGKLKQLQSLIISDNQLKTVPKWLGQLKQLQHLDFSNPKFRKVWNNWRRSLRRSRRQWNFDFWDYPDGKENTITSLPSVLAELPKLNQLHLDSRHLDPALRSAYYRGFEAVRAYLRSISKGAEPLHEARLVLVGEGDVGKTTLLKALKGDAGDAPKAGETTTHGIDIHKMKLPHPEKEDVEIQLNAWDFGGQNVYRVTHQFFFSRRSLYILVWEPRGGVGKGQVEDWLNMIRLRVGADARVIIVSTHAKTGERIARIDQPVFLRDYPEMIAGFYEVDSLVPDESTGEMFGIAELKEVIAAEAAQLEQMGMLFNNNWKAARDELIESADPRISYTNFAEVCAKHTLSEIDISTLAGLMHDLGYIVHYGEDENLRNDVVLKPQWLTKAIGFVLEDRATQEADGILPDERLFEVWHDHEFKDEPRYTPELYPFFLRLMEKYDVSYRLPDGKASLVAQHVPQVRPELPWLPEQDIPENARRIAMICAMDEDPPGLMPWMIVRTHDYAVDIHDPSDDCHHRLHWQKGMFLKYEPHGEAFVEKRGRELHVYAQADWPQYFMTVLQDTLKKLIKDNWPGLEGHYRFTIPCPTIHEDGKHCKGRFQVKALREFMAKGVPAFPCQDCFQIHSISDMLMGFAVHSPEIQLQEINQKLNTLDSKADLQLQATREIQSRITNYFVATMRAITNEAKSGPRLFNLRSRDTSLPWEHLISRPMEVHLWCEHDSQPHPVVETGKGIYELDKPHDFVVKIAPTAKFILGMLKLFSPMTVPSINIFGNAAFTKTWEDEFNLGNAIIGKLPDEIKASKHKLEPGQILDEVERSGILALHQLIREQDPTHAKLGLHRVTTYTGDFRWLCKHHYEAWQPNIPDVIEGKS